MAHKNILTWKFSTWKITVTMTKKDVFEAGHLTSFEMG